MKTWVCIKSCVWGKEAKLQRHWKVGETFMAKEQPNKHFMDANPKKVEAEFEFDKKTESEISVDDMKLMTKRQLNKKFNLGIADNRINPTSHKDIVKMAIQKTSVIPRQR